MGAINPYGRTKEMMEKILVDWSSVYEVSVVILRYFNPVGAHPSGKIGENPLGIPNNLFPFVSQVAVGRQKILKIYGNDYNTKDGTAERDYIHVMDLADAHILCMSKFDTPGSYIYNFGSGTTSSVLEVVKAFEKASGRKIPYEFVEKRPGDSEKNFCDPKKAEKELGFVTKYSLDEMCRDGWNWQIQNPEGF